MQKQIKLISASCMSFQRAASRLQYTFRVLLSARSRTTIERFLKTFHGLKMVNGKMFLHVVSLIVEVRSKILVSAMTH